MLAVEDLLRDNAFVNGHWVSADSGNRFEVTNPADGATLTSVPDLSPADVVEAIDAARARDRDETDDEVIGQDDS